MKRAIIMTAFAALLLGGLPVPAIASGGETAGHGSFTIGQRAFLLNGEPFIIKAAEVHYPRIPRPYWEHRIKMCKALGMNTLCIYVFWNYHEQQQDQFCFEGQADVAEFCRLAQKNGMYVIVRPGPYACAEWEMGGLPWWLLKKRDIRLREQDPFFMERARIFEEKLAEQLRPYAIYNGGPIIMVQVENEYGSYGEDKAYMSAMRDIIRGAWGEQMTLFQCDWSSNFWKNGLDDLTWTMNFGTGANIDQQFRRLSEMRPDAPLMCSEFWSGWFDKWGARHETRPADAMVAGLEEMLSKGISFSLYMTHGGTSFGHWAGANSPGFAPDVTSYDYDAPINEYGQATPKYHQLREMLARYNGGQRLPSIPRAPMPVITVPRFELTEFAPFFYATKPEDAKTSGALQTFEEMNLGWGSMFYATMLPEIPVRSVLTADIHDYAQVFIDGSFVGKIDRVMNERSLMLPPVRAGQKLVILVEAMGRINFGRAIKDYKGIVSDVTITADTHENEIVWKPKQWEQYPVSDDYEQAVAAFSVQASNHAGAFTGGDMQHIGYYRGYFNINRVGDTFLDFETWGKGQVWVNGHALGRIWSIGPQQTLYMPGCWLKKGRNEIIVLDITGPRAAAVWGQAEPELNKLQLDRPAVHNDPAARPSLSTLAPATLSGGFAAGTLPSVSGTATVSGGFAAGAITAAPGNGWQTFRFAAPQQGRYLAIECLSTHQDNTRVAIAELYLQGQDGHRLSRETWTTKYADSEDAGGNHTGDKVFDLQESTYWQTERSAALPHLLVIDLGSVQTVTALELLPRAEQGAPGAVREFRAYIY
ncbi:MAG: beta-galactosidase [Prevotella sp.]|nr:beta-galactosidase [Prevotella sp.]